MRPTIVTQFILVCFASLLAGATSLAQTEVDDIMNEAINQTAIEMANDMINGTTPSLADMIEAQAVAAYDDGNLRQALLSFQVACNHGSAKACHRTGEMYEAGEGTNGDVATETAQQWALTYYDGACQRGYAESCPIVQPYYDYYANRCEQDADAVACVLIGNSRSYGWAYTGLQPKQAARDYETACDLGLGPGCSALGDLHAEGLGVEQSSAEAIAYFELGCRRGDSAICDRVGRAYKSGDMVPRDDAMALLFFELGCDQQDANSCKSLGYEYWNGDIVAADKAKAKALLTEVCAAGDVGVCNDLPLLE